MKIIKPQIKQHIDRDLYNLLNRKCRNMKLSVEFYMLSKSEFDLFSMIKTQIKSLEK